MVVDLDEEKSFSYVKGCVFENGIYSMNYIAYTDKEIEEGVLYVDTEPIAELEYVSRTDNRVEYRLVFQTPSGGRERAYPFLMRIDTIRLNLFLRFRDESELNLQSSRILVTTKNDTDQENLSEMIYYIASDTGLYREINRNNVQTSLIIAAVNKYFNRLFIAIKKYRSYYFTTKKISKLRYLYPDDGNRFLMGGKEKEFEPGIQYERDEFIKFLNALLIDAKSVKNDFRDIIYVHVKRYNDLKKNIPEGFSAPVITTQELRIKRGLKEYKALSKNVNRLQKTLEIFGGLIEHTKKDAYKPKRLFKIKEINEIIRIWQVNKNLDLQYQRFFFNIESLDKLYEYYCLARLLNILEERGYIPDRESDINFTYKTANSLFENEEFLYNTFYRKKDQIKLTLYFQPVIYRDRISNELELYRTTGADNLYTTYNKTGNYYSPDFVLKISGNKDIYLILDSKFQSRNTILKGHMDEVISKYFVQIRDKNKQRTQYVYVLQGRSDESRKMLWQYENSDGLLTDTVSSFGIIQFSPDVKLNLDLVELIERLEQESMEE